MKTVSPSTTLEGYGERPSAPLRTALSERTHSTSLSVRPEFVKGRSESNGQSRTISPSLARRVNGGCKRSVKFYTLGCKVNQYDTQSIRERFLRQGFKELTGANKAERYLINTCSVTSVADRKSRERIRSCIRENPKAEVIVTGCLVNRDHEALSRIKGVGLLISKSFFPEGISSFSGHTRAFLKVQDGCNNFCSYCKVPLVRGASRSRPLNEIIQEAGRLAAGGFKEVVLTGICLGAYGIDLKPRRNLVEVIEALENIKGFLRIRLSSIELLDISEGLIKKLADSDKLCRHLHIPLQSADDSILKRMNRRYSALDYLKTVSRLKREFPDIAITIDCMVGFPGETKANFLNTIKAIKAINPLRAHIFPYSARPGTKSSLFKYDITQAELRKRIEKLNEVASGCSLNYRKRFLGKRMDVLFENRLKDNPCFWQGYSSNYLKVAVKSRADLSNRLVTVQLKKLNSGFVTADLC